MSTIGSFERNTILGHTVKIHEAYLNLNLTKTHYFRIRKQWFYSL